MTEPFTLNGQETRTLAALAEVIVSPDVATTDEVVRLTVESVRRWPAPQQSDVRRMLSAFGSPLLRLVFGWRWTEWSRLDVGARATALARWGRSRIPGGRTAFQGIRRLVLSSWYNHPAAHAAIGVRQPLHTRRPDVAWEGPMPGLPAATGVVALGMRDVPTAEPRGRTDPDSIRRGVTLRGETRFSVDVVVIGSGAGGSVVAAKLAEAGREVLVLEAGPWVTPSEMTEDERTLFPRLFADGGTRATHDLSVSILQGTAVGGGTLVNWMIMLRTPDHVLDEWQRRFGLVDLTPTRLSPIFGEIEDVLHVEVVPDAAHSPSNRYLLDGARRLGWHATPARLNTRGCVRAGTCSLGCRFGAKQSATETWLPRAFAHGARLLADTRVERIEVRERDTGSGPAPMKRVIAVARDEATGQPVGNITVDARTVVVAAGAIETPALLIRSGMGGGAVGQYLRLHPTTAVLGAYGEETYSLSGLPLTAMCDEFVRGDPHGYGFWLEVPALATGLLASVVPGFGAAHRQVMRQLPNLVPFIALTRDGGDLSLSNGSVGVNRSGRPRIRYALGPADRATMSRSIVAAARLHLENGATSVRSLHHDGNVLNSSAGLQALASAPCGPNDLTVSSAHVNGTCRMGTDSRTAGASPDGQRFGHRGVFIADGSLLPTAPGVNPQETVMALANLIAERIASK